MSDWRTIERVSGLRREVWRFDDDPGGRLKLRSYKHEGRRVRRNVFRTVEHWLRNFDAGSRWYVGADEACVPERKDPPPLPADVRDEALRRFREAVTVAEPALAIVDRLAPSPK